MDQELRAAVKTIWKWLPNNDELNKSDMIFVFGSDSLDVPVHASQLYGGTLAPFIVVSGGFGRLSGINQEAEADIFASILRSNDVPNQSIIIENKSSNTGENISFSKKLLMEQDKNLKTGIAVTTPLLSRRQMATLQKQWPEINWLISTCQPIDINDRLAKPDAEDFLNLIVGELDRLQVYPAKGFMVEVSIPEDVLDAKATLKHYGYNKHSIQFQ